MEVRRRTVGGLWFALGHSRVTGCMTVSGQGNRYNLPVESANARPAAYIEWDEGVNL